MSYLNVKPLKYDWDNIDVGNNQLNHSQNFFSKKHFEHERLAEMEFLQQRNKSAKSENGSLEPEELFTEENKENLKANISSPLETCKVKVELVSPVEEAKVKEDLALPLGDLKINDEVACPIKNKIENELPSPLEDSDVQENGGFQRSADDKSDIQAAGEVTQLCEPSQAQQLKVKPWSCQKQVIAVCKGAVPKAMPPPPHAYLVKDIYKRNREEAERRRAEEERKKREFHSRPAPKFKAHNEQVDKLKPIHAITVSKTPQVLKTSREAAEKRRKRLEEWKLKNQPPKFEPRPPTVLKEKPFVPEKKPHVVQQCPFKLNMEKRLQDRKQYDEAKLRAMEEKHKQVETEEEERKRREEGQIKELRKAATFKARPNPFNKN